MYCPKHPKQKMTLLLYSWVCDECDPPQTKQNSDSIKNVPPVPSIDFAICNPFVGQGEIEVDEDDHGFRFFVMDPTDYDGTD